VTRADLSEADALLAADPAFQTVCDEHRDAWMLAPDAEPVDPQPWQLAWCGDRDGDDAAEQS
jgi:hypothetical protein